MNRSRYTPIAVALLCVTAIGVSATTLESSLATDPEDEIGLDYDRLPIGQSDAATIRDEIEGGGEDITEPGDERTDGASGASDREQEAEATQRAEREKPEDDGAGQTLTESDAVGEGSTPPTLLDRLLASLVGLIRLLVLLSVGLALAAGVYRHRNRFLALVGDATSTDRADDAVADTWPETEPSSAVDRAWVAMVRWVDPERPETMTPAECAAAARESGLDAEGVAAVTDAFERVNYGGVSPATVEERAREGFQQLDIPNDPPGRNDDRVAKPEREEKQRRNRPRDRGERQDRRERSGGDE